MQRQDSSQVGASVATAKSERTRARLLDAARHLIAKVGTGALSVQNLCRQAGIGRTSFYNYFEDCEMLLAELASEVTEQTTALFNAAHADLPRGLLRLECCLVMVLTRAEEAPEEVLLITAFAGPGSRIRNAIGAQIRAELIGDGGFRPADLPGIEAFLTANLLCLAREIASGHARHDVAGAVLMIMAGLNAIRHSPAG